MREMFRLFKRAINRACSIRSGDHEPAAAASQNGRIIERGAEKDMPVVRPRSQHPISRRNIDPDALKVLYRLKNHGFTAYLVGGSVRDLMLGRRPKDFDIGTNAHPNQIRKLFRNCFLVGRRFRLAHIRFGPKIIETSTFRRAPETPADADEHSDLLQRHDNTFGTPEEDARRRDFTINGLFYDISTFSVIDHVGGLADLERRVIRSIGNPDIRFREDPVRMIRAVRFASRLGFTIEPETWASIQRHSAEILKASPPRMLEEIHRLFAFRSGEKAFRLLAESGLMKFLFPEAQSHLDMLGSDSPLWHCLRGLDGLDMPGESPTPALIWGTLVLPLLWDRVASERLTDVLTWNSVQPVLLPMALRYHVPKHVTNSVCGAIPRFRLILDHPSRQRRRRQPPERVVRIRDFDTTMKLAVIAAGAGLLPPHSISAWNELYTRSSGQSRKADSHPG